jgi:multicomponent Na+:H+ antiporter subunit C
MLPDIPAMLLSGAIGLIIIGLGGLVLGRNLYRLLLALAIAEAGANLLLVMAGFRENSVAPIVTDFHNLLPPMVDPVPQAMVLTAIVIGVGVQALALTLIIRIRQAYGTLDMNELKKLMEADLDKSLLRPGASLSRTAVNKGVETGNG